MNDKVEEVSFIRHSLPLLLVLLFSATAELKAQIEELSDDLSLFEEPNSASSLKSDPVTETPINQSRKKEIDNLDDILNIKPPTQATQPIVTPENTQSIPSIPEAVSNISYTTETIHYSSKKDLKYFEFLFKESSPSQRTHTAQLELSLTVQLLKLDTTLDYKADLKEDLHSVFTDLAKTKTLKEIQGLEHQVSLVREAKEKTNESLKKRQLRTEPKVLELEILKVIPNRSNYGSGSESDPSRLGLGIGAAFLFMGTLLVVVLWWKKFLKRGQIAGAIPLTVLSKSWLDPTTQILFVKIRDKVLVLAKSNQFCSTIDTITDRDEINLLTLHSGVTEGDHTFRKILGDFTNKPNPPIENEAELKKELDEIKKQMGRLK